HRVILHSVGAAFLTSETVFEYEGGDAASAEPLGQRIALVAQTELRVATARADDDGRTSRSVGVRNVWGERGIMNVADIGTVDYLGLGHARFGTGSAFGPKRKGLGPIVRQLGEGGRGGEKNRKRGKVHSHGISVVVQPWHEFENHGFDFDTLNRC